MKIEQMMERRGPAMNDDLAKRDIVRAQSKLIRYDLRYLTRLNGAGDRNRKTVRSDVLQNKVTRFLEDDGWDVTIEEPTPLGVIDIFASKDSRIRLIEVKRGTVFGDIPHAIGQLQCQQLIYPSASLWLALPFAGSDALKDVLARFAIKLLTLPEFADRSYDVLLLEPLANRSRNIIHREITAQRSPSYVERAIQQFRAAHKHAPTTDELHAWLVRHREISISTLRSFLSRLNRQQAIRRVPSKTRRAERNGKGGHRFVNAWEITAPGNHLN